MVSLLINVFYYAMDASDFGGIIDDFNKWPSAYLIIADGVIVREKGVSSENG
ncbi:MAG: hypothetical protein GWP07_04090 [Xanthomonadaceae bacterium]|nr:hypothetical protein [Xanthomonadaceae bacterium]